MFRSIETRLVMAKQLLDRVPTNLHDTQYFKFGTDAHDRNARKLEDIGPYNMY